MTRRLIKESVAALLLATLVFAPGVVAVAQTPTPPGNPMMALPELLKGQPGVLGVETAQTSSGKLVIFAWFENKKAALTWYYSHTHQTLMKMAGPSSGPRTPMADVPDDGRPIMAVASVTLSRPQDGIPPNGLPAMSQVAIELYAPLPGGAATGGRFAPPAVNVPGLLHMSESPLMDRSDGASRR